jgi:hypothetical protein
MYTPINKIRGGVVPTISSNNNKEVNHDGMFENLFESKLASPFGVGHF